MMPGAVTAAVRTWDGGGTNNNWTTATNWVGDVAPVAGDDLVFPSGAARVSNVNNFPADTLFNSITISGANYFLTGSGIILNAGVNATNTSAGNWCEIPLTLSSNQTITSGNAEVSLTFLANLNLNGNELTIAGNGFAQLQSVIRGPGGLLKTGSGTGFLYASNTFSGPVQILQGILNIYAGNALGATNGGTTVAAGAVLALANAITVPEPLILSGQLIAGSGTQQTLNGPVTLQGTDVTITVHSGGSLTINGVVSGSGGFVKAFTGILSLNSTNTYTGTTTLNDGALRINGSQPGSALAVIAGTLTGTGTVGTLIASGATAKSLVPGDGPAVFNSSTVVLSASTTLAIELNGTVPGTGYDQLNVTGTVSLANCALSLSVGFQPALSNSFIIVNNDGADSVIGTFAGLAEGALVTFLGNSFRVSYLGGTGNDVTLTTVAVPSGSTWDGGGANANWSTATNWLNNTAPAAGVDLIFPLGVARLASTNNFAAGTIFNSISIGGTNYVLYGSNIVLNAGLTVSNASGFNAIEFPILLASNQTFTGTSPSAQIILNGNLDIGGRQLTFAGTGNWNLNGTISGTGSMIKASSGGWAIDGNNTFTGPFQILQGFIQISHSNALGSTNGNTTISSGAQLNLSINGAVPEPIVLAGTLSSGGGGVKTLTGPVTLSGSNATIRVASNFPLTMNGEISGASGFTKTGFSDLVLNAANAYTGTTTISDGTLFVNGAQPGSEVILNGGTLGGTGTVARITSASGGAVRPGDGPGILNSSNVIFNAATTFAVELNGTAPGSGYDQLNVNGTVTLNNAALSVTLGFTPAVGNSFVIINNDSTLPVGGTFNGLPEGAFLTNSGALFRVSYAGSDGNNVVLSRVNPPAQFTAITRHTNNSIQLEAAGLSNLTYTIQATTNLNPVIVWSNLGTATANSGGVFSFADTNAPLFPMRFYRAQSP